MGTKLGIASGVVLALAAFYTTVWPALFKLRLRMFGLSLEDWAQKLLGLTRRLHLIPLLKQLLGFYQIVSVLDSLYDLDMPKQYWGWLSFVDASTEYLVFEGVCAGSVIKRLVVVGLLPFFLVIAWVVIANVSVLRRQLAVLLSRGGRWLAAPGTLGALSAGWLHSRARRVMLNNPKGNSNAS